MPKIVRPSFLAEDDFDPFFWDAIKPKVKSKRQKSKSLWRTVQGWPILFAHDKLRYELTPVVRRWRIRRKDRKVRILSAKRAWFALLPGRLSGMTVNLLSNMLRVLIVVTKATAKAGDFLSLVALAILAILAFGFNRTGLFIVGLLLYFSNRRV